MTSLRFLSLLSPLFVFSYHSITLAEPPPEVNVTIRTKAAQMRYDTEVIQAAPGAKVNITLKNEDDLPHNLVVCKPAEKGNDKGMDVAQAAWAMGESGMVKQWIPDHPRVLAHTAMVDPHKEGTLSFNAPETTGEYPFVCTFPGHALVMNGVMKVNVPVPPIKNLHFRYYEGEFKEMPDFAKLNPIQGGPLPSGKCDIELNKPKDKFAYEFEGFLECPKDAEYKFFMGSDDGSRLIIDGNVMLDLNGIHPFGIKEKGKVKLTKGEHKILVQYFEFNGEQQFYLGWSGPGFSETALSTWSPDLSDRKSEKDNFYGMPLIVEKEALIYRNFIAGSSPRGIAVGYPGGINLCWDADQMSVALVWQGAFMDAKGHWSGRGNGDQPPLGYDIAKLGQNRALGILESQTSPWASSYQKEALRNPAYRFHGYELDEKRQPTFKWEFNGVQVVESFAPSGDAKEGNAKLKRTLRLSAEEAPKNLYLLALSGAIEQKESLFVIDKAVKATVAGAEPLVRQEGGKTEVLLPVTFKDGKAELTVTYAWSAK
ncbi:hypothetical protein BH11VER1_BH11VER1_23680 [soil metagenome]